MTDPNKYNASGCKDMTAYHAIGSADKEMKKVNAVRYRLQQLANKLGFTIVSMVLKDNNNKKIWR